MLALARFYGWTLDYIRTLNMSELDAAGEWMVEEKKREAKQHGV